MAAAPTASTAPVALLRGGSLRGLNRCNATLGGWRDYVYGARVSMPGSTAKSALAWQVLAGTLRSV